MGLKIKEKFKGKIVRRHLPRIGSIAIDTEKLKKKDFEKWHKRGLDIFEVFEGEEIEDEEKPVKEIDEDEDDDIDFDDEESEENEDEDESDESELDFEELEKLKLSELREKFPEIKATSKKEFLKELKEQK